MAICPGAGDPKKSWDPVNFLALAGWLRNEGRQILWIFGPAESSDGKWTNAKESLKMDAVLETDNVKEIMQCLSVMTDYLGNDSGMSHLAAAIALTTTVIFGPTDHRAYKPVGPKVTVFEPSKNSFHTFVGEDVCALTTLLLK